MPEALTLTNRQESMRYSQFSMTSFRVLGYVAKALRAAIAQLAELQQVPEAVDSREALRTEEAVYQGALDSLDALALEGHPVVREHRSFKESMYRCLVEHAVVVAGASPGHAPDQPSLATLRALGRINQFVREAEQLHQIG